MSIGFAGCAGYLEGLYIEHKRYCLNDLVLTAVGEKPKTAGLKSVGSPLNSVPK